MSTNDGLVVGSEANGNGHEAGWTSAHHQPWSPSSQQAANGSGSSSSDGIVSPDDPRIIAALETYLESLREGRPCSRSEFLARHADISGDLSGCFAGLEFIEAAVAELASSPSDHVTTPDEPALPPQALLGDYHILREVGRGGMGVVYEAEQISLGRRVALKVLPFAAAVNPEHRQRFQIEAQAAAQLHHPHIVPIFGVGCEHGIHYYAMQFVDGRSLAAIIRDIRCGHGRFPGSTENAAANGSVDTDEATRTAFITPGGRPSSTAPVEPFNGIRPGDASTGDHPGSDLQYSIEAPETSVSPAGPVQLERSFFRTVARLGIDAADALEHAHALGILHRDIKPANLLIDRRGAVWITDFGLARLCGDVSLTGTGDIVGTLRYMSPEQALAHRGVVDQRTDVYALGATLYEVLALRPAFDGRDHQELLRQITLDEPIPPRRLNPAVPRDLETIVLKAMAKDPSKRYATAQELSADLNRFMNDDPILGRRPGPVERAVRWASRRRVRVATAAAIFMLSLLIGTAATWYQARETKVARNTYRDYIIKVFPLLEGSATAQMEKAHSLLAGKPNAAIRDQVVQEYEQVLRVFHDASELPPTDLDSRVVIARALCRLAYTRTMLSFQKGTYAQPDAQLMAQAGADYRRSITLLEKLLDEERSDPIIRRYLADALGLNGMGCYLRFTHQPAEAERYYKRAIELRRDLVRGNGFSAVADSRLRCGVSSEGDDPSLLVLTVNLVAMSQEDAGRPEEAVRLRRQLEDDVVALAARFPGPEFIERRRGWANKLAEFHSSIPSLKLRRANYLKARLAVILDPEGALHHNNLAWVLISIPDDPWFDPIRGLAEARKAIELQPNDTLIWNTLGVAAFRARDWTTAHDSFMRSINLGGGSARDRFFLAMTHWNQGNRDEARKDFDIALAALKNEPEDDPELARFHAEAAALMSLPGPKPAAKVQQLRKPARRMAG
jgi:serine/threonine protein kinase